MTTDLSTSRPYLHSVISLVEKLLSLSLIEKSGKTDTTLADEIETLLAGVSEEGVVPPSEVKLFARPLRSPLSSIILEDKKMPTTSLAWYVPHQLDLSHLGQNIFPAIEDYGVEPVVDLSKLIEDFKRDISQTLPPTGGVYTAEYRLAVLLHLIRKHFWAISAGEGELEDVSFSEYARLEAAFKSAKKIAKDFGEIDAPPYRYLIGDISGIQNYIFGISKAKTYARRLRGRSLFIQLITEDIKRYCLAELHLPDVMVLMTAGGKFLILVPNTNTSRVAVDIQNCE